MSNCTQQQLDEIESAPDLYVAPLRKDGTTYGTFTQTWPLVVDGNVYVRAANGTDSRWYQAAIKQGAGRVRVGDQIWHVTFIPAAGETSPLGGRDHPQRRRAHDPSLPRG